MRKIAFTKMEGCGNDYVYLDGFSEDLRLAEGDIPSLARAVSDRHYGVGSDGLVLILPPTSPDSADLRMRMFNADGSEAEMCGNASRCVGRFAWEHALTDRPVIRLETLAGVKLLQRVDDAGGCPSRVCVDMGTPELARQRIPVRPDTTSDPESPCIGQPIRVLDREWAVTCVSMGNPHAVTFVDDPDAAPVTTDGPVPQPHQYRIRAAHGRGTCTHARLGTGCRRDPGLRYRRLCRGRGLPSDRTYGKGSGGAVARRHAGHPLG